MNDPGRVSSVWVNYFYELVDKMICTETDMTRMKTKGAIKLENVKLVKSEDYPPEENLPNDGLYTYLLQRGEEHGDQRKKATDRKQSKNTYTIDGII